MSNESNKLQTYTSDLLALEKHFLSALRKQKTSDKFEEIHSIELINELEKMVSMHVESMEEHVERLGGEIKSEIKSQIASFTGTIAGLIDRVRNDSVSKMFRDDYVALSMITMGYTMLHTFALAEDEDKLADVSIEHMENCTAMVTEISKIVPLAVASEIIDDKQRANTIGQMALENTQNAWKPMVVNQEPNIA